ncbi:MAG: AAA family ATPase [Alphaproteobacteria bacterium]
MQENEEAAEYEEIQSLRVMGLFGRFDHEIFFHEKDDVTIITAPNGYGKTIVLRIIDSIFNQKFSFFLKLSFNEIRLDFKSGKSISMIKKNNDENSDSKKGASDPDIVIKAKGFGGDEEDYGSLPISIETPPSIRRLSPERWYDRSTEETYDTDDIIKRYGNPKFPEHVSRATGSVKTHLVETQRLLSLEEDDELPYRYRRIRMKSSSVVERNASDLSEKIGEVLQRYANEAQKLDESFPKRIIREFREEEVGSAQEIRKDLKKLGEKRDALVSVGLIGSTVSEPIQPSEIDDRDKSVHRTLSIYIDDTTKKLDIFDKIYEKIRLFKQILDNHFKFKKISIDSHEGIQSLDVGTGEVIPLSELSSGEQHELVLIYDLLFSVEEGSVILIDEPELSLHVDWQKRFISDIQKIQELKDLKVVIATHSPYIINDKWELNQALDAKPKSDEQRPI